MTSGSGGVSQAAKVTESNNKLAIFSKKLAFMVNIR